MRPEEEMYPDSRSAITERISFAAMNAIYNL